MSALAQDVAETVQQVQKELEDLRARYPEERALLVHLAYNWRVYQLLEEAGQGKLVPEGSGLVSRHDDVSVFRRP